MENGAISPDCNSFNAEYSKRGTEDTKYLSTTGRECGCRGCFNRLQQGAFTLAEVLITLSIIGVVAALTIPSLIINNQEKETIVRLKKAYSTLNNAFILSQTEYGEVASWDWGENNSLSGSKNAMDKFSAYLNIMKQCNGTPGCFAPGWYVGYNGAPYTTYDDIALSSRALLSDGTSIFIWSAGNSCKGWVGGCGYIIVDINGFKKPNALGKDVFYFYIKENGIIPYGSASDTNAPLESFCRDTAGVGCAAWAIFKENLNYPPKGTGWD